MYPEEILNEGSNQKAEKKESPQERLEKDLKLYSEAIHEVAVDIMVEGLSRYPIFVAHLHVVKLGELILDRHDLNTEWTIQASTMEEFVEKGIIKDVLKVCFIKSFKNPVVFLCL